MRILLIGGNGFIGPLVAAERLRLGHDVAAFHRSTSPERLPTGVRHYRAIVKSYVTIKRTCRHSDSTSSSISSSARACRLASSWLCLVGSALRSKLQTYPPAQIALLKQVFGWLDDEYDKRCRHSIGSHANARVILFSGCSLERGRG